MLKILEIPELLERRDELIETFNERKKDISFLGNSNDILNEVEEWKYSTGDIFDTPPFSHEMAGFDGGRVLKKKYSSPFEARIKGAYSSGFAADMLKVVVHPSKPLDMPLIVSRLTYDDDLINKCHIKYFNHQDCKSSRAPSLISLKKFYEFKENIRANVGVGDGGAYSIFLYYYNEKGLIIAASMVSAPFNFQSEYQMQYNDNDELILINSDDMVVWKRK